LLLLNITHSYFYTILIVTARLTHLKP